MLAAALPQPELQPPEEFDDYVGVHLVGRGQMGRVYQAEDSVLARSVVIKFIAGVEPDLVARRRFLMEARAAARIQHPNVVAVYRVGELGDRPYIVSELVRGRVLAERPKPIACTEVEPLAIDLARGLAAAHRRGVVHCDIKPGNVIVGDDGTAKLFDFGLARLVHEGGDDGRGDVSGTPDYMAPEVWAGEAPTRRSDVYSIGAVLYELVAGAAPFADVELSALGLVVRERAAPALLDRAPDADPRLARLIDRCLARDPAQRFASGDELREALEQLGRQRHGSATPGGNPYRGLRPFEAAHRAMFFGRAAETGAVVARLRVEPMVLVTGDSGVGKSSLCRAGVVPAITDGVLGDGRSWTAITIVPGTRPLTALAAALGDPTLVDRVLADPEALPRELQRRAGAGGLLVFVDQMEELVTVADPVEVAALDVGLTRIGEGVSGVRVVASVRADFLSRLAALPLLGQDLSRLLFFVRPLQPEHLREVVVGPAAANDVRFESEAFVDTLVAATAHAGSGGLPLLSFALSALWEVRDEERGIITDSALRAMGGVDGALARHADAVVGGLSAAGRGRARRMLMRLVTSIGTRVRRTETELAAGGGRDVLDALVAGRLLVVHALDGEEQEPVYEIAHEILVRSWATLREWLEHDAARHACHERVTAAAAEWERTGRRSDMTWRGAPLAEAIALDPDVLAPAERAFLRASQAHVRRQRWMRRGVAIAVVASIVAAYFGQRVLAQRRLDRAVALELRAAGASLADARAADRQHADEAAHAFARFDAGALDEGEHHWQIALGARTAAARAYRDATGRLEAALAKDAMRRDVRSLLAETLYTRAELAERTGDLDQRDELIARLTAHDVDGRWRRRWTAPGRLTVRGPPGADVALDGLGRIGAAPVTIDLPPGSHVVTVSAPGLVAVRHPVVLARGGAMTLDARPPMPGDVPAGFIHVPAGEVRFGSDGDEETRRGYFFTVPAHPRPVAAFLIAAREVTFAEWIGFLEALPAAEQARRTPGIPAGTVGTTKFMVERRPTGWHLTMQPMSLLYEAGWGEPIVYRGRASQVDADWRELPVTAVSADDAVAYAAWLDRSGRVPGARLCSELEWERAARGSDSRRYPHGDQLDPLDVDIDATHGRDHMGPDEVGSHPRSRSPFGVDDMAGNAFEWTTAILGEGYVGKGGSYFYDAKTAQIANRAPTAAGLRDISLGVRICATPQASIP